LAEFPVAWVDKNVEKNGTEQAAKAYLNYLWSPDAQKIITSFNYRVYDKQAMAAAASQFPATKLFKVEDQFGSWPQVMQTHFSSGGLLDKLIEQGHQ